MYFHKEFKTEIVITNKTQKLTIPNVFQRKRERKKYIN